MDQPEFQRFVALSFRKLVVLRSEVFEEAEVPHLLVAENATFSEDALIIANSLQYMKDHLEKFLYRQSKERVLKIFKKIRELHRKFQEGCYYAIAAGRGLPNDLAELKRLLEAYFLSLANQNSAQSSQSISSNSSLTRSNRQSNNPTIKSSSSTSITAATSTRKAKSPLPNYERVNSQQMIRSKSSSSKHLRSSSSNHKRNATTIIQNKGITYGI